MKTITSADFQKNFGHHKRDALHDPISISIHGKPTLVVMSQAAYELLVAGASKAPPATSAPEDEMVRLQVIAAVGYETLAPASGA